VLLADRTPAPDDHVPHTGLPHELERALSAPFIVNATYGTRCSTVLTIDTQGHCDFRERRFDAAGDVAGETSFSFAATGRDTR
jgi:uncharacterized protein with NRDE domain